MYEDLALQRSPLTNLMKVVGLSAGVVSRRTLKILLAVAEMDGVDRRVEQWGRLLFAIQAADTHDPEVLGCGYRRRSAPSAKAPTRTRSGVRPRVSLDAAKPNSCNVDPLEESG